MTIATRASKHAGPGDSAARQAADTGAAGTAGGAPSLAGFIGFQLRRVSEQSIAAIEVALADLSLRLIHYTVLSAVQAEPGVTQSQICRRIDVRPGNLVPIINDLVGRGLVSRRGDAGDKRIVRIVLEPGASALVDVLHSRLLAHEARFFAALSAAERTALMAMLRRLGILGMAASGLGYADP